MRTWQSYEIVPKWFGNLFLGWWKRVQRRERKHFVYSEFYFEPVVIGLGGILSISGFH